MSISKKEILNQAIACFNSNDLIQAKDKVEEFLSHEPKNIDAINLKGGIFFKSNQFDKAVEIFEEGLEVDPINITMLKNIITAQNNLGRYRDAYTHIEKLNQIENNSESSVIQLVNNLLLQNKKQKALNLVNENLKKDKTFNLLLSKANCLFELQNFKESKILYKKLLEIHSINFHILFRLGYLCMEEKNFSSSIDYFKKITANIEILKINNNELALTYYNIGLCYEKIEDYPNSEENYLTSITYNNSNLDAYVNLSNIHYAQDKIEEATTYMKKAIELNPNKRILYVNLSNIYDKAGKHNEAVFCKRVGTGNIVFKCSKEYGLYEINKVQLNEKI